MARPVALGVRAGLTRPTASGVGALAGLALLLEQTLVRHAATPLGDELIYERMAAHPFATHTFPFGYRVGLPWLVHVLPFSHQFSFQLLALLCIAVAAGLLHALMTRLKTPPLLSALLCVAFAISPGVLIVLIRNGRNDDAATLLVMIAAALFIAKRQPLALCLTLVAGAFVRESTLFMIPFAYAVWADRWFDRRALAQTLAAAAPAIVIYAALRLAIPTVGREQVVGYSGGLVHGRVTVVDTALSGPIATLRRVFLAFGPLWLLLPLALVRMRWAQRGVVLLALCAVAMTFALDWGRIALLAAPVVYPAAGFVLLGRRNLRIPILATWLALCLGYAVYMDVHGVTSNVDHASPPTYPVR